jgi:penicillin V acylase-like amidase (Ntn superfamily)
MVVNPQDRFVRASYYMNAIPQTSEWRIAVASVFSVMRNVSVPYGISNPDQPHISSTRWRAVADQKRLVYYFENVLTPNVVWIDFRKLDFDAGTAVKKLALDKGQMYAGEVSSSFEESAPFEFKGIEA